MENLQEKIFFGEARANIESVLGLSIEEIKGAKEVNLPSELLDYSTRAIEKTQRDHHEYMNIGHYLK